MVRRLVVLVVLALAAPSAAQAAEVSVTDGVLTYTASAGQVVNNVTLRETGPGAVTIGRDSKDEDPLVAGTDCSRGTGTSINCTGVTRRIEVELGGSSDRLTASFEAPDVGILTLPITVSGGDGNDAIVAGADDDTLRGGDGNDELHPNVGSDAITGGDGVDRAVYGERAAPRFTLDGLPNDGDANENDLIGIDVEDVDGAAPGVGLVTMVGDGRANHLRITRGRGDLSGGDGADVLEGGALDDVLRARDGSPDTILCGAGADTVEADTVDVVSTTCETVSVEPTPGGAFDDRPPAIAWTVPAAGTALPANQPTPLAVNASDDRGVARVQFFDDDRLLCDDAAAPFTCAFQPRGGDVGRNTLIAVAVDGANQTTSAVRPVLVRRFNSLGFSLSLLPSRDRRAPYAFRASGRLARPTTVPPSQGCLGSVLITARAGRRVVSSRRTPLSTTCEYELTLRYRSRTHRRLRLSARFSGNDVVSERVSSSRTIRLG